MGGCLDPSSKETSPASSAQSGQLKSIKPAPLFELKDQSGNLKKLSSYKGQAVLVHFWASWCPPCIKELPEILKFAGELEKDSTLLILISLDTSWEEAMTVFPKKIKLSSNVISVLDPDSKVNDAYGSYQYPETYLLNRNLEIVTKWVGPQKWDAKLFREKILGNL